MHETPTRLRTHQHAETSAFPSADSEIVEGFVDDACLPFIRDDQNTSSDGLALGQMKANPFGAIDALVSPAGPNPKTSVFFSATFATGGV